MIRRSLSALLLIMVLVFSGCSATDKAAETAITVGVELKEAYQNLTAKITDTKDWIQSKVLQTKKAVDDVQEAAESVDQAVDSLKELTGTDEEKIEINAGL